MEKKQIKALQEELEKTVLAEVRFDEGSRALYATDASNYRQMPIGVVIPKNQEAVRQTIHLCKKYGAPLLCRGAGTSLAGQCCNVAVIMDLSKYLNRILHIDPDNKRAIVEPGVVLDTLQKEARKYQLTFGPDPATHAYCTIGGMIGNNSCGMHSIMAGKTDDNVFELQIMTYDGVEMSVGPTSQEQLQKILQAGGRKAEIYAALQKLSQKYGALIEKKYPKIPRCVSGYNLPWLLEKNGFDVAKALVGSESTCVTILSATLKLVTSFAYDTLLVLGYPDIYMAADQVPVIMEHLPICLEGLDEILIGNMKQKRQELEGISLFPEGNSWLLVQFGGENKLEAQEKAQKLMQRLQNQKIVPTMLLYEEKKVIEKVLKAREAGLGAAARGSGKKISWAGWEDAAVSIEHLGTYLREFRKLLNHYGYHAGLYGHFGQGCVHARMDFDFETEQGVKNYRSFLEKAADLVVSLGGSFSGEHGDGQARGELLPKMFGEELMQAFREFKAIWDPERKMNPGKLIDAYKTTENLRLSSLAKQRSLKTHFSFAEDGGSLGRATSRCIGVGKCRREEKGTMCPSYMVTKEEKHSTRGRAHLLFEMLQGEVIGKKGWKDEHVKEALDLCLSCKGCKTECPMNVDMATYKAEFLSHYYRRRMRPLAAYAFGWIYWWAKIATHIPCVANFVANTSLFKWLIQMPQKRQTPHFATENFRKGFLKKSHKMSSAKKILLWPDTFSNYFHPQHAHAAVEVLEHLGFEVLLSKISLCCGRPLYDYGMLTLAKKLLKKILKELNEEIQNGTPIVGLEPSCISVFRDEMTQLFPHDKNAQKLKENTYLLSEFVQKYAPNYPFKPLNKKAIVHGHCHHTSVLKFDHEKNLLKRLGLDFEVLDSGCCGMAGSFGFEKKHYEVSMKAAERVLLPSIRQVEEETLIITNGFSCREQIEQATQRKVYHLSEVILMSLKKEIS